MNKVFKLKNRNGSASNRYYGKVNIAPGDWRRVRLFVDMDASKRELRRLQTEIDQKGAGVIDTRKHSRQPIADHVAGYFTWMAVQGYDADHISIARNVLNRLVAAAGWRTVSDMNAESVDAVLPALADTQAYRNQYVKRARAFASWLRCTRRTSSDLLAGLKRKSERGCIRKRARRSASAGQYVALLQASIPEDRRLAYALACLNGLRRNEVGKLTWDRVRLHAPIPFIEVPQKNSANDTLDSIPLHPYVAALLRQRTAGMPGVRLLRAVPDVATLKKDWNAVGVKMIDERGLRIDFHGLRHTFTTALDLAGVSRATKKRLTRHAAEDVTDGYAHAELSDMLAALAKLHSPLNPPTTEVTPMRMTGTDYVTADQMLYQMKGLFRHSPASTGNRHGDTIPIQAVAKTVNSPSKVFESQVVATCGLNENADADILSKMRPDARVD